MVLTDRARPEQWASPTDWGSGGKGVACWSDRVVRADGGDDVRGGDPPPACLGAPD